jgi:hypothetical protein
LGRGAGRLPVAADVAGPLPAPEEAAVVFMIGNETRCLQCMMSDPMSEAEAREAVRLQDEETPGLLAYYPCPVSEGYHLTIAEARRDGRRP